MPGIEQISGGHLEKKKDWLRRTKDYQEKAGKIKKLKRRARERNPDEFDFHMLRSQVGLDGVHRDLESDEEEEKTETQRLLGDIEDIQYVRYHLGKEQKKIEKLKSVLHFCATEDPEVPKNKHTIFVEDEEEAKNFDPSKYFKTPEHLLGRVFNRPKADQLGKLGTKDAEKLKETEKERRRLYSELGKRMKRESELAPLMLGYIQALRSKLAPFNG